MVKFGLTVCFFATLCNFSNAAGVPAICKGKYSIHYAQAHLGDEKFALQTVREMTVKLSDGGSLNVTARIKGDKDANQYNGTFNCDMTRLFCTNANNEAIQLKITDNGLIIINLKWIRLYNQNHLDPSPVVLVNRTGGDDIFELFQLTNSRDCT